MSKGLSIEAAVIILFILVFVLTLLFLNWNYLKQLLGKVNLEILIR